MADNDVRIKLSLDGAEDVKRGLAGVGDGATSAGGKLTSLASGGVKGLVGAFAGLTTAAAASAGALGTAAVKGFAEYEQNIGGIETMFKDSAGKMQSYAEQAYQTAGMSANEYMSQVTSFSASLLQGLGGDTEAAADIADMAMVDMSDNANKFGSNIADIQNAYQGFAKQNYTMLDNLKLGYGGTQAEMARLINDSGVLGDTMEVTAENVNEVSFDKIIEAIHKTQDELGVTGTTAKEASQTIEGSVNSTKAAFDNLLVGLGRGDADVAKLASNVLENATNVVNNITPVIENIGKNMGKIGPQIGSMMEGLVDAVAQAAPALLQAGVQVVGGLLKGIASAAPGLATSLVPVLGDLVRTVVEIAPQFLEAAITTVTALADGLAQELPTLIPLLTDGITKLVTVISENEPLLISAELELIVAVVEALLPQLPTLLGTLIDGIVNVLVEGVPLLMEAGVQLIGALLKNLPAILVSLAGSVGAILAGLVELFIAEQSKLMELGNRLMSWLGDGFKSAISAIAPHVASIWNTISSGVSSFMGNAISKGGEIMHNISNGFRNAISTIGSAVASLGSTILTGISNFFGSMRDHGSKLITNLKNGISSMVGAVAGATKNIVTAIGSKITGFFGTMLSHGKTLVSNLANGISGAVGSVISAAHNIVNNISSSIKSGVSTMVSIGGDLVRGVWSGISGAAGWLQDQASQWASNFINGIKNKFKIHSPSRLFRDEIGKNLMLGVAVGIDKNADAPLNSMDGMFKQTMQTVKRGVGGVARVMRNQNQAILGVAEEVTDAWSGLESGYKSLAGFIGDENANRILTALQSYGTVANEIKAAFQGGDWGYGELSKYIGDGMAVKVLNVSAAVGSQYRKAVNMGTNLVKGVGVGINRAAGDLQHKVNQWAGMLIRNTKRQFGIASPSKVFRDAIGRNLMLGVADGINTNSYEPVNALYGMFSDLQPVLRDGVEGARRTVEDGVKDINEAVEEKSFWEDPQEIKSVVDEFTGMINELDKLFGMFTGDVDSGSADMMSNMEGNISHGSPRVENTLEKSARNFIDSFNKGIARAKSQVTNTINGLTSGIRNNLAGMSKNANDTVGGVFNRITSTVRGLTRNVTSNLTNMANTLHSQVGSAMRAATGTIGRFAKDTTASVGNMAQSVQSRVFQAFKAVQENLVHIGGEISSSLRSMAGDIQSNWGRTFTEVSNIVNRTTSSMSWRLEELASLTLRQAINIYSSVTANAAKMALQVSASMQQMAASARAAGMSMNTSLSNSFSSIGRQIELAIGGLQSNWASAVASITRGSGSLINSFGGVGAAIAGMIPQVSNMGGMLNGLLRTGGQIAAGLTSGILGGLPGGWGAIASGVIGAARLAFGIHSPSKLMHDEVGVYLAQGLVKGMSDTATLSKGANNLAANLTDVARGAGSGMVDELTAAADAIDSRFQDLDLDLAGSVSFSKDSLQGGGSLSTGTAYSMPVNYNYPTAAAVSSAGPQVSFNGPMVAVDTMEVRNDQDIRKLSNQLSQDINKELRAQGVLA